MSWLNPQVTAFLKTGEQVEIATRTPISYELFRGLRATSPSRLKKLRKDLGGSPLHYQAGFHQPWKRSPEMDFGNMYDRFLLEPDEFARMYVSEERWLQKDRPSASFPEGMPKPDQTFRQKANALWKEERLKLAEEEGMEIVPEEWFKRCEDMRDVLFRWYPYAKYLIEIEGEVKYRSTNLVEFEADLDPVLIKYEADKRIERLELIVDVKTGRTASPGMKQFRKHGWDMGYFSQAAIEIDGDPRCVNFSWIVQETVEPYAPCLFHSDGETLAKGRKHREGGYVSLCEQIARLRKRYGMEWDEERFRSGRTWPPYLYHSTDGIDGSFPLHPPTWI